MPSLYSSYAHKPSLCPCYALPLLTHMPVYMPKPLCTSYAPHLLPMLPPMPLLCLLLCSLLVLPPMLPCSSYALTLCSLLCFSLYFLQMHQLILHPLLCTSYPLLFPLCPSLCSLLCPVPYAPPRPQ